MFVYCHNNLCIFHAQWLLHICTYCVSGRDGQGKREKGWGGEEWEWVTHQRCCLAVGAVPYTAPVWGIVNRDQGWKQLTAISLLIVCYLNFCIFNRPKKNSNSTQCIQGFLSRKNLFKFESKHKPQPVIWQSLQKAIPEGYCLEDNGRFSPAKWPSSWSSTQAQHWQVGLSSTNRQCFQVCISRCWPWQARLRKKCCHSWDTDLDLESKRFWCFVIFGQWRQIFFLIWNEIFDGLHDNLLSTKAALIASLNPLVFDWSLIKIGHRSKYACSVLNPVQSSRSK